MQVFDGIGFAQAREDKLRGTLEQLGLSEDKPVIVSFVPTEDAGSQLYTQKKQEAAERVGIAFRPEVFSLQKSVDQIVSQIKNFNQDEGITGVMVQKPAKKTWEEWGSEGNFGQWWKQLVAEIDPEKDVDGLTPTVQQSIMAGTWQEQGFVLPATAQAILLVLEQARVTTDQSIAIIGRSDIVGRPTHFALQSQGFQSELLGRADLEARIQSGQALLDFDVVVSATGVPHLITGSLLRKGVTLIDVGEPKPDIDSASVEDKADFLSPVPGGVGPITVVCLLENAVKLFDKHLQ